MAKSNRLVVVSWIAQVVVAGIFVMASIPKLTGDAAAVKIFNDLGAGDAVRYAVGVAALVAAVLILVPKTVPIGAIVSLGVISGAIVSHLAKLGIAVEIPDGTRDPSMFVMAVVVFVASLVVLAIRRAEIPVIGKVRAASAGAG